MSKNNNYNKQYSKKTSESANAVSKQVEETVVTVASETTNIETADAIVETAEKIVEEPTVNTSIEEDISEEPETVAVRETEVGTSVSDNSEEAVTEKEPAEVHTDLPSEELVNSDSEAVKEESPVKEEIPVKEVTKPMEEHKVDVLKAPDTHEVEQSFVDDVSACKLYISLGTNFNTDKKAVIDDRIKKAGFTYFEYGNELLVGPFDTEDSAIAARKAIVAKGLKGSIVMR